MMSLEGNGPGPGIEAGTGRGRTEASDTEWSPGLEASATANATASARSGRAEESDTERSPMLTPSEVLEHVYCARYTWFMQVQNISQNEDKRYKVLKGREVHRQRETENKGYLRKKIGVEKRESEVYLASSRLRIRGVVDEVLWLRDGTMAPLDYKYTKAPEQVYRTHRLQVLMYGMLIEEVYGSRVTRGYVAYVREGSELKEIELSDRGRMEVHAVIDEIFDIIATGRLPKRTPHRVRCDDCCYRNICV